MFSNHEKGHPSICRTWMNSRDIVLNKRGDTEKNKYCDSYAESEKVPGTEAELRIQTLFSRIGRRDKLGVFVKRFKLSVTKVIILADVLNVQHLENR